MSQSISNRIDESDSLKKMGNPLCGLTIRSAVGLLDEGERGIYTRLAQTYRRIEKRWSVMIGLLANREGALLEMDWDIRTIPADRLPPGYSPFDAMRQAVALRKIYEQIENLYTAVKFLHLASFRGFAHLEKLNEDGDATANPAEIRFLAPLFQAFMIRDGLAGEWRFDERLSGSFQTSEPIDSKTMIFREVENPVGEVALLAYIYEVLGRKDWAGFVEVFGIPDLFFVMPQNASKDDQAAWQAQVEAMIGAGSGILPNGTEIKVSGGDIRGTNPFAEFVRFQREDVVLAGTGGTLTMLSDRGSGTLAGGAQSDVFKRIAKGEARQISEIFQRQIDLPFLEQQFPGQPPLAWFEIAAEDAVDVSSMVGCVCDLAQQGYLTDPDQVQEKTGFRVVLLPPEILQIEDRSPAVLPPPKYPSTIEELPLAAQTWARLQNQAVETGDKTLAGICKSNISRILGMVKRAVPGIGSK